MKQQPETLGEALSQGLKSQMKQVRRLSRQLQRQQAQQAKHRSQARQTAHPAQHQSAQPTQPQQYQQAEPQQAQPQSLQQPQYQQVPPQPAQPQRYQQVPPQPVQPQQYQPDQYQQAQQQPMQQPQYQQVPPRPVQPQQYQQVPPQPVQSQQYQQEQSQQVQPQLLQQPQQFQSAETLDHVEEPAGEGQFSFDRFWNSPEPGQTDQSYQTQTSENPAQPAYEDAQMREGHSPSYSKQEYTRMEANPEQNTEYQDTDKEMQQEENRESVLQHPVHRGQDGSFGPRGGGSGSYSSMEQPTQRSSIQQTEEIDLIDLFGYYMSRLPLLIAAVVIGAMVSGLFTHYFIPNRYTAVSRMYMISASSDSVLNLSDLNLGASLSNDYVELMKSRPIVEEVIDTLGLEYTYEQVVGMIGLSVVNNTRIVKISATSTDPYEAMQISNEMARVSKIQLPKVMDAPAPTIVEEAVLPAYKSSPSLSRNVMMGAMLLLVLVLGVLTVFYLMDDTIKTSEDVEREFGIMPLTVIPEGNIEGLKKSEESKSERRMRYWKKTRKKKKKKKKK